MWRILARGWLSLLVAAWLGTSIYHAPRELLVLMAMLIITGVAIVAAR